MKQNQWTYLRHVSISRIAFTYFSLHPSTQNAVGGVQVSPAPFSFVFRKILALTDILLVQYSFVVTVTKEVNSIFFCCIPIGVTAEVAEKLKQSGY